MNALLPAIGNAPLISAIGINQIEYTVSDWVGIGAYLTTAVVGLSGFVVFGSVAAFQGIAAEANAPTSLDPSMIAPDIMSTAPPMQMGSQYSGSSGSALSRSQASMLGFTGQHTLQAIASLSHSKALSAQHSLEAMGVKGVGNNFSTAEQWAEQYGRNHGLSFARATGGTGAVGASDANKLTNTDTHSTIYSATAGGHVGGGPLSAGAAVTGKIDHAESFQTAKNDTRSANVQEAAQLSDNRGLTHTHTRGDSTSFTGSRTSSFSVASKERELFNAVNTYNRAESAMSSVSAGMNVSLPQAVQALSGNSAAMDSAIASAHSIDPGGFQRNLSALSSQGYFPNSEQATTAAALLTLQSSISSGGTHAEGAALALNSALSLSVPGWSSLNVGGAMSSAAGIHAGGAAISGSVARMTGGIAGDVSGARDAPTSFGGIAVPGDVAQHDWTAGSHDPLNHEVGLEYGADAAMHDATSGLPMGGGLFASDRVVVDSAGAGELGVHEFAQFGQANYDNTHPGPGRVIVEPTTVVTPTVNQDIKSGQMLTPDQLQNLTPEQQRDMLGGQP